MRDLAILTFQSLDRVMQAPKLPEEDTSGNFADGGWAAPYWDEVMALVSREAMSEPYDALFGRKTYDMFAAHQPSGGTPLSDARKYVVTSNSSGLTWQNSVPLTDDIPSEIGRLKESGGPLIQVHGSWQLVQALLAHDLVDEFRIWTFPLVVGDGKRLFSDGTALESVRRLSVGLQSFRSMSRMDASLMKASALRLRFSQSLASRRQRLSQAMVRSTTQRLGWTTKPFTRSDRLTISVSRSGRMPARAR